MQSIICKVGRVSVIKMGFSDISKLGISVGIIKLNCERESVDEILMRRRIYGKQQQTETGFSWFN